MILLRYPLRTEGNCDLATFRLCSDNISKYFLEKNRSTMVKFHPSFSKTQLVAKLDEKLHANFSVLILFTIIHMVVPHDLTTLLDEISRSHDVVPIISVLRGLKWNQSAASKPFNIFLGISCLHKLPDNESTTHANYSQKHTSLYRISSSWDPTNPFLKM